MHSFFCPEIRAKLLRPAQGRAGFIEDYAKRFGIFDALGNTILSYSHGMRQKVHVMGALLMA